MKEKITKNINLSTDVNRLINSILPQLKDFLNEKELFFEIDEKIDTFAFDPFEKKVLIGKQWADKLEKENNENIKLFFKVALFHEVSHYRDLKIEQDFHGKSSMKKVLTEISEKKIQVSESEYIPIGEAIHRLYNEIDDIVVNKEAENFLSSGITAEIFEYIYKTILFPYKDENGNIVTEGDIDYSKKPLSHQFSDFMLRSFMVPKQKIILKPSSESILKAKNIVVSYKRTSNLINEKENKFKNTDNKEIKNRYNKVKHILFAYKTKIQNFSIVKYNDILSDIFRKLRQYFPNTKNYLQWSIYDILKFFTLTKGIDENHQLIIPPYLRYEIISKLLEPLHELFILIDWIETGKVDENKKGNGDGEENESKVGGEDGIEHDNMDLEEKIKLLDKLEEKERKQYKKNEAKKQLATVFDENGIDPYTQTILKQLLEKNKGDIADLVKFFEEQIKNIEKKTIEYMEEARKGKIDYSKITAEIAKDPTNPNLSKPLYNTIEEKEIIEQEFKKMDFVFVIDISGSMDFHKGSNGALSNIIHIFSETLMHLEKSIQNMLQDKEYKIDMNFILYGDDIGFSTLGNKNWEKLPAKVKFAKSFEQIQRLSGGTDDRTGWQKVAEEFEKFLNQNKEYLQEVLEGKRRPVVLQIADSDVTEDGVTYLKDTLKKLDIDDRLFSIKRLILGEYTEIEYSPHWNDSKTKNGKTIKKQEFVWSKEDIIKKIKSLFENFIYEYTDKK